MLPPSEYIQLRSHLSNRREQATNAVISLSVIAICTYVATFALTIWMRVVPGIVLVVSLIFFLLSAYSFMVSVRAIILLQQRSLENDAKIDVITYHLVTDEAVREIEKHANTAKGA